MIIRVFENRSVTKDAEPYGTQNENRVTTLNFEFPEGYENFNKKIVFITSDGNYWDIINDNTYIIKNNITKYKNISAFVWLTNVETQVDFRTKIFDIDFNKNINPDDYTPSEEQISGFDTMMQELNEAIEEVQQLPSMKYEIVEELPTEDIDTHTIYLILREEPEGNNYYDEYLYINNSWEKIGSTDVDLSDLIDDIENLENRVFSERNVESESNTLILENTEEDMGLEVSEIDGWTEQETYEGYNLLVYPYNYLNGNGTTLDKNVENDLEITGTTTTSGMAHFYLTNAVELKTNTTYTITRTIEALSGTATSSTGQIELYIGSTWKKVVLYSNQTSATFTVNDNAVYRIIVKLGSLSETSKFKISNFMIYEGTGTKPFEQYVGGTASPNPTYPQDINVATGTQEVVVSNKVIFDNETIPETYQRVDYIQSSGTQYIDAGIAWNNASKIVATLTSQATNNLNVFFSSPNNDQIWIGYSNSNTMTGSGFSSITITPQVSFSDFTDGTLREITFDISSTKTSNISFGFYLNASFQKINRIRNLKVYNSSNTLVRNMIACYRKSDNVIGMYDLVSNTFIVGGGTGNLTKGDDYQEQTQQLRLGDIELAKIGTYVDRIYKEKDKWYLEKNIRKYAINGTSGTFSKPSTNRFNIDGAVTDYLKAVDVVTYMSDHYVCYEQKGTNGDFDTLVANENFGLDLSYSTRSNTIRIKDTNFDDINQFKTWLASNNVELYYALATPTITEITDTTLISDLNALQHLKQYDNTTIITIDDIREYQVTLESDRIVVIENEQVEQNDRIAELEEENSYLSSIVDQIIPKETAEGSSITLDNTLQGKLKLNEGKGDTEQDTTTGINLFIPSLKNIDDNTTITKSNAVSSLTLNDNEFIFVASGADVYFGQVGTAGNSYSSANGNKINVGSATKISYRLTNTDFNRGHFTAYDSNNVSLGYTGIQGNTGTYTIPSGTSYVTFRFGKNDATSGTTYITKVIVALGDTIPDYQDYTGGTASPNPTYPQDIEVVRGKNRLNNTLTDQTKQGITFKVNDDKSVLANGTGTGSSNVNIGKVYLQAGETIYLSGCPSNGGSGKYTLSINETGQSTRLADDTGSGVSYTPTTSGEYDINLNYWYGFNIQNLTFKPMLEKGTQANSYLPYNTLEVKVENANLFIPTLTNNGSNITQVNASVTLNGDEYTFVASGTDMYFGQVTNANTNYADTKGTLYSIEEGEKVYFLLTNTLFKQNFITFYDENKTSLGFAQIQANTGNATAPTNAKYYSIRIGNASATSGTTYTTKIMTSKAPITSYVEHQEQTKTLHLSDIELAKIGSYQDRIYKNNDKWYIEKNIGKVNLKDISWTYENVANRIYGAIGNGFIPQTSTTALGYLLCTHYTNVVFNTLYQDQTITGIGNGNGGANVTLRNTNYTSLAQYTTEFTNNTEILYYAKTPTYEEITNETLLEELNELEKMMSYNGQTNISINGNLPMIINVTALKNLS